MNLVKKTGATPPAAKPNPVFSGQMPMQPGQRMRVAKLLPEEEVLLKAAGWQPGDPIPNNIAEIIDGAQFLDQELVDQIQAEATDPNLMPPPAPLNTPKLVMPKEQRLEDMPEERRVVLQSMLRQAKEMQQQEAEIPKEIDPSIRQAVQLANGPKPTLINDLQSDTYANGIAKESYPEAPPLPTKDLTPCSRCGWPKHLDDPVEATDTDKTTFVQCLLGMRPFEKEFPLYDGKLRIRVRSLTPAELDAIVEQLASDMTKGRARLLSDQREMYERYRTCLQIIDITGLNNEVSIPRSLELWKQKVKAVDGDTVIRSIYDLFHSQINVSEHIHRTIGGVVQNFNTLCLKLEANCHNSDFWKALDAS